MSPGPQCREFASSAWNAWLKVTAFVALLALDTARIEGGRLDVAPCAHLPPRLPGLGLGLGKWRRPVPAQAADDDLPTSGYQSLADRGFSGGDDHSVHGGTLGELPHQTPSMISALMF